MESQHGKMDIHSQRIPTASFLLFVPNSLWIVLFDRVPLLFKTKTNKRTTVLFQIFLHSKIRIEHFPDSLLHCLLFHKKMSLNIDINRILPVKFSGVSPNLYSKLLTSSLSCNVLNPGKYSTRIPLAHHRFCHLIHPNVCSHASLDSGFSKIFPGHNKESEKT